MEKSYLRHYTFLWEESAFKCEWVIHKWGKWVRAIKWKKLTQCLGSFRLFQNFGKLYQRKND